MSEESLWHHDTERLLSEMRSIDPSTVAPAIEGYRDLVEIGRGGQGAVYRGVQESTSRVVAIKVLLEGTFAADAIRGRFEREIRLIAELHHPCIVQIYDSGIMDDGRLFYSMEYIDGQPFNAFARSLDKDSKGRRKLLEIFAATCDAVSHAHHRGVIHRDLKPSNIRVDENGVPHVLDFGLAKPSQDTVLAGDHATELSITGQFIGSLPWVSPEQASGSGNGADVRADIYALGMILFNALTDEFPYKTSGVLREVLDAIALTEPTRPSLINRSIDNDLETILLRCLAKDPMRRYQSASELAREIRRLLAGEPIEAKRDSAVYVFRKTIARHRAATATSLFIGIALILFGITMTVLYNRAMSAEHLAESRLVEVQQESAKVATVNEYLLGAFSPRSGESERTVEEMLMAAAERIETDIVDQDDVRAEVHFALSFWFSSYGYDQEAKNQQKLALEYRNRAYGEDSEPLIDSHRRISFLEMQAGDLETSLEHAQEWLRLHKLHNADDQDELGNIHGWLAELYVRLENPAPGLANAQQALSIREATFENADPRLDLTRGMIGISLAADGQFDDAEPLISAAYSAAVEKLGKEHRNVLWLRDLVDEVYTAAGRDSPLP